MLLPDNVFWNILKVSAAKTKEMAAFAKALNLKKAVVVMDNGYGFEFLEKAE